MHDFLLVDDNETFATLLMRGFLRRKLNLQWAKNGEEALLHSARFDGIILDLNLDGESGLRLLPQLRLRHPESRVIVLTGFASISTAVSAVKLGAVHYLPKPADINTILHAFEGSTEIAAATEIAVTPPSLKRLTWEHIQYMLEQNSGNVSATARALNMHRRTLQRMLAKYPVKE